MPAACCAENSPGTTLLAQTPVANTISPAIGGIGVELHRRKSARWWSGVPAIITTLARSSDPAMAICAWSGPAMTTALSGRGCVPWPGLYSGYEQMTFSNPASVMRPDRAVPAAVAPRSVDAKLARRAGRDPPGYAGQAGWCRWCVRRELEISWTCVYRKPHSIRLSSLDHAGLPEEG